MPHDRKQDVLPEKRSGSLRRARGSHLLDVNLAILDEKGIIIAVNDAWRKFGRRNGLRLQNDGVGARYLAQAGGNARQDLSRQLNSIADGKLDFLCAFYPCHSKWTKRWFALVAIPLSTPRRGRIAVLHVNVTPLLKNTKRSEFRTLPRNELPALKHPRVIRLIEHSIIKALAEQVIMLGHMERTHTPFIPADIQQRVGNLSGAQLSVFHLLGAGKSNKQIADTLGRSPNTIKLHVSMILRKLKLERRAEAAVISAMMSKRNRANGQRK